MIIYKELLTELYDEIKNKRKTINTTTVNVNI